ncbi:hypothetical protein SOVF_198990, partial [Spinacia oleracea]
SGLFSPNPQNNGGNSDQIIVKGGHRAVVVEYGDDVGDGKTKVSISSPKSSEGTGSVPIDEQISRAAASVAGVAQDVKGKAREVVTDQNVPHGARPRELICDAYGKCKHKIAGVWSKTKEKAAEAEETVEEVVEDVVYKAKDLASRAGHKAEESAEGVRDNARKAGEAAERVKDKTGEKIRETGEKIKEKTGEKMRETGEKVRETGEIAREKVEKMKGKTEEMVEETGEKIKEKGRKGKKEFFDIARRGKEVISDAMWYTSSIGYVLVKEILGSVLGVAQLMGIATAYGIGVWVTFINSHVLAGILGRQQFGMVQSKIYPVYFKAMVGSIGLALLGHLLGHGGNMFHNKAHMLQGYNLMTSLLFVLGNLLFLEPRATKAMFDRMKLEKEEGRGRNRTASPTRVIDTVVTDSAGPVPTTTTTTAATTTTTPPESITPVGRSEEDKAKSKLARLDERLKKLNSFSSLMNIMTLMGLTWHLVYLSQRLRANTC